MTVEFMLLALALFGGVTLREFAVILLVGYSAVPILQSLLRFHPGSVENVSGRSGSTVVMRLLQSDKIYIHFRNTCNRRVSGALHHSLFYSRIT